MQKFTTFLMFNGQAEAAMKFYTSLFKQSEILNLTRYGANEDGVEGSVQHATFTLNGQEFMCIDGSAQHAFTFTPSMSLYVRCATEEEIDRVFTALAEDGQILMPLDRYPFSRRFGWVADRFGVSWQLNLEPHSALNSIDTRRTDMTAEPQLITKPAFTVVGLLLHTQPMSPEISALWDKFVPRMGEIPHPSERACQLWLDGTLRSGHGPVRLHGGQSRDAGGSAACRNEPLGFSRQHLRRPRNDAVQDRRGHGLRVPHVAACV